MSVWFEHVSERVAKKEIDFETDTFILALTATANPPDETTDEDLTDLTEISYTNLSSRILNVSAVVRTGGTTEVFIDDILLSASGGSVATFRYACIYDDTTTPKHLIAYKDLRVAGVDVALNSGDSHEIRFNQSIGAIRFLET